MKNDSNSQPRFLALLAAAAFPGLGHVVAGELSRAIAVAVGVLGLFLGGLFIGGIDVIDSKENRIWFLGQAMVGPLAFGTDYLHQSHFKAYDRAQVMGISSPRELERISKRSANPNEQREIVEVNTNQGVLKLPVFTQVPPGAQAHPPNRTSIGKVNELGTLFATIAGFINLIAVIDAGFPGRPKKHAKNADQAKAEGALQ